MAPASSYYSPQEVGQYFDASGEREWQRLVNAPFNEISLYIHRHYLEKHIRPGMQVLEIGAGAGRFTQILAERGARVTVADLSAGQLELNRRHAAELEFSGAVEGWHQADICDLSRFAGGSFEAVVAYGGPFSYVLERRDQGLAECMRVLQPGGPLLLSVMCLWGTVCRALEGVLLDTPPAANHRIIATGDITPETFPERAGNFMHLFRAAELRAWLEGAGLSLLDLSASGCLAASWGELLGRVRSDPALWQELLAMELQASAEAGCLDMGTHLIAAVRYGVA